MKRNSCAVLLAAYNGISYIGEQVESIVKQEKVDVHLFISVDKSSDGTYEWCVELASKSENVTVLPYGEVYGGAAKNFFRLFKSVDFSDFDFVSLSDQDDIWFSDKLYKAISELMTRNADAYSGNVIAFWKDGSSKLINKAQPQRELDFVFEAAGPGCTYVITTNLAIEFQDFLHASPAADSIILHDWLLYAFARSQNYCWFIDSIPHMKYRQHDSNQVGVNNSFYTLFRRAIYIMFSDGMFQVKKMINVLPFNDEVKKYSMFNRKEIFLLLLRFNQLRRKPVERIYAFFALLIVFFIGIKTK